jgi:rhodanese-related sulfurtransferase
LAWRRKLQSHSLDLIAKRLGDQKIFYPVLSGGGIFLSQEEGDRPVDNVDVEATWQTLESRARSQLIDVRTRAEWTYVGIPDLGSLNKRAVLVEWQTFPDQTVDPRFAERLAAELNALGVKLDDDLFFICRSGGRSLTAAKAMAAMGYRACHNVAGGFEGPLDDERHRGTVGGWKAAGLPWLQG